MGRRIEGNFNQGWGIAAFITLLAAAGFATFSITLVRVLGMSCVSSVCLSNSAGPA